MSLKAEEKIESIYTASVGSAFNQARAISLGYKMGERQITVSEPRPPQQSSPRENLFEVLAARNILLIWIK